MQLSTHKSFSFSINFYHEVSKKQKKTQNTKSLLLLEIVIRRLRIITLVSSNKILLRYSIFWWKSLSASPKYRLCAFLKHSSTCIQLLLLKQICFLKNMSFLNKMPTGNKSFTLVGFHSWHKKILLAGLWVYFDGWRMFEVC